MLFCLMSIVQPAEMEYPEPKFTGPVYDVLGQVYHYTDYQFEGIDGKWKNASEFSNGLAAVSPTGEYVNSDDYDYTIWVEYRGKWGFINAEGEMVIPAKYDYVYKYNDFGLALVGIYSGEHPTRPWYFDMKWGYIDKEGNEVIPIEFDMASEFLEDDAVVLAKFGNILSHSADEYYDKIYIYNSKGEKLNYYPYSRLKYSRQTHECDSIYSFNEGLVAFATYCYDENNIWGLNWCLVDTKGNIVKVLDKDVGEVFRFKDGVAKVIYKDHYSRCLTNWTDDTGYFYDYFYYTEYYYAYIDKNGNYIIPETVNHNYPDIPSYFTATSESQSNQAAAYSDTFRFIL